MEALIDFIIQRRDELVLCLSATALVGTLLLLRKVRGAVDRSAVGQPADLELERKLERAEEERRSLQVALEECRARLADAEAAGAVKGRPEHVNAELVHLLSLFQEKGRLIDFLMEDVTGIGDAQVGAAARVVHQGCSAVIKEYFAIEPVHEAGEGSTVTLSRDFSPRRYRLVGKVKGEPPYTGTVLHRGWRTKEVNLPRVVTAGDSRQFEGIIAPSEVEVR